MSNDPLRLRLARYLARPYTPLQLGVTAAPIDDSSPAGWTRFTGLPNDRDLAEIQQLYTDAMTAWRKNPIAKRIIEITTDYVIGDGITLSSPFAPLNDFTAAFWSHEKNHIHDRLEDISEELARAGDLFPVLFRNPHDGMSYLRFVIKSQIIEVVTADNDWENELAYAQSPEGIDMQPRLWRSPSSPQAATEDAVMLHFFVNRPIGASLGESDLNTVIPWMLRYSRMLEDRVRLHAAARAFLYTVTVPDTAVASKQAQYAQPPESGSIIIKGQSETWETITPNLRGADASSDMEAVRIMIDAGSGYPPHWRGEASSANLATASAMQAPAERHLKRRQRAMIQMLEQMTSTAYLRQPNHQPIPSGPRFRTAVSEISRDDNLQLAQAAAQLTQAFNNLVADTEPKSRTLLRTMLEQTFKFMGEPQPAATIDKILDEIYSSAEKGATP